MNKYLKVALIILCAALINFGIYYGAYYEIKIASRGYAMIEPEDIVKINDVTYEVLLYSPDITKDMIREKYAEIKFCVGRNIHYTGYKYENGDSGIIAEGTELFKVKGYDSNFRLIAYVNNYYYALYEVVDNPHAKTGSDLLDIRGRVKKIKIETAPFEIINESDIVEFVDYISDSKVAGTSKEYNDTGGNYWISFFLEDGTTTSAVYNINSNTIKFRKKYMGQQYAYLSKEFKDKFISYLYTK